MLGREKGYAKLSFIALKAEMRGMTEDESSPK